MYRRVFAVLLLIFAGAFMSAGPSATAQPGGGGGGNPTCPDGSSPPCSNPGGGGGGGGGGNPVCPPGSPNEGNPPPCGEGYQPDPIVTIDCLEIFGDIRDGAIPTLLIGGDIRLLSPPGCLVGGRLVVIVIMSEPHVIGQARALEDGSVQIDAKIPPSIPSGTHNLSVRVEGQPETVRAIQLASSLDLVPASHSDSGSPTSSAMLALWALLIVGGGAVLASVGWRRVRARSAGAGGLFGSRRQRSEATGPTVPLIDTSGFVPQKPTDPRSPEELKD